MLIVVNFCTGWSLFYILKKRDINIWYQLISLSIYLIVSRCFPSLTGIYFDWIWCVQRTMVLRLAILRNAGPERSLSLGFQRWVHTIFQPAPPLQSSLDHLHTTSPLMVLPEAEIDCHNPNFSSIHGSMELMAVPKRKARILWIYFKH